MTLAAASGDNSASLFATPRLSPIAAPTAASWCGRPRRCSRARAASATGWSIGRGRRRTRIFLADRASADAPWTTVTYEDALRQVRAARGVDPRARAERRASAGDPVRQQRRARAVRARRPACRRALGCDLAGLFADVQGFRQAQEHDHAARARRDLCLRAQSRSRRRWRRSSRCIRRTIVSGNAGDTDAIAFPRHRGHAGNA